jgi:hypothetical protein
LRFSRNAADSRAARAACFSALPREIVKFQLPSSALSKATE